jgi:hypothetical protein
MGRPLGRKNGQRIITTCNYCSKTLETSSIIRKYCSRKCYELSKRNYSICPYCSTEFRNTKGTTWCSRSCMAKARPRKRGYNLSEEHRKKISEAQRGEKANNWRGGITEAQKLERQRPEYKIWRQAVFTRDNYTCQVCFVKGGSLQADHIKPWIAYPELRLELGNGRTLCVECHKKTPTYARNLKYQEHL